MARRFCHLLLCTSLLLPIPGGGPIGLPAYVSHPVSSPVWRGICMIWNFAGEPLTTFSLTGARGMFSCTYSVYAHTRTLIRTYTYTYTHVRVYLYAYYARFLVNVYLSGTVDTFTGVLKTILCKACSSSDHVTDSWPLFPRSTDSAGSKRGDLCFNFNKGVPCPRTPCPYTHQCNKPGCTAAHPGKEGVTLSRHLTCNYLRTPLDPTGMVAISMGNGFRLLGSLNTSLTPPWVLALTGRNCLQFTLPAASGALRDQANIFVCGATTCQLSPSSPPNAPSPLGSWTLYGPLQFLP